MTRGLFVTPQPESLSTGGGQVTHGRIAALRALGIELNVLRMRTVSSDSGTGKDMLRRASVLAHRALAHGYPAKFDGRVWTQLREAARESDFVFLDGLYTAEYGRELKREGLTAPLVLHEHNVEHALLARRRALGLASGTALELSLRERRFRWIESHLGLHADLCLALTKEDTRLLQTLNPGFEVRTVPHPVDTARYAPRPDVTRAQDELLFIGTFHWPANVDSLRWFTSEVWPLLRRARPQLRLSVVGRDPPDWVRALGNGIEVHGFVEDERLFFARAAALVIPLRYGGGMRVKILNAWAMQTPIVSTPVGAEGLPAKHEESLLLAENAQTFAEQTLRLIDDHALANALAAQGHRLCERHFTAGRIQEQLRAALARAGVRA